MASVPDTALATLVDGIADAFRQGGEPAARTVLLHFFEQPAAHANPALSSQAREYYAEIRDLALRIDAARARNDGLAVDSAIAAFQSRHAGDPILSAAADRLSGRQTLPTVLVGDSWVPPDSNPTIMPNTIARHGEPAQTAEATGYRDGTQFFDASQLSGSTQYQGSTQYRDPTEFRDPTQISNAQTYDGTQVHGPGQYLDPGEVSDRRGAALPGAMPGINGNGIGHAGASPAGAQSAAPRPAASPALNQAFGEAEEALEYGELREALEAISNAVREDPGHPRIAELLGNLLDRAPDLASQVRNLLEPFESRLGPDGESVLFRARQGLMSPGDGWNGPTEARRPTIPPGSFGGPSFTPPPDSGMSYVPPVPSDGPSYVPPSSFGGAQSLSFGGVEPASMPDSAQAPFRAAPPVEDPVMEQLWQQAMGHLDSGRIPEMIRLLRRIPFGDRHYEPAQSYLEIYRPDDTEMQRVAVELARLIVQHVGTLVNLGDPASLAEIRDRMLAARKLIDDYNFAHPDRPMSHPAKIDEWEEIALKGLQGWAAWERAQWALKAGLPSEAVAAFLEFQRLEPNRATLPNALQLKRNIDALTNALMVAQRFQAHGVGVDLQTLGVSQEMVNDAAQNLIACVGTAMVQAQMDAQRPPDHGLRVTTQHLSMLEQYRDLLQVGMQLLDLKPRSNALRQLVLDPSTVGRDYEGFLTSTDALIQSVWRYAGSPYPSLRDLCGGAAEYARNVLEGEANTLIAAAARAGLPDSPFIVFLNHAHTLLQKATQLELSGQRLDRSVDPRQARTQSIRDAAKRIDDLRRARDVRNFAVRVLQPIAVVIGVCGLLGGLFMFSPTIQEPLTKAYETAFPLPTPTATPRPRFATEPPDGRTLQNPPACKHENGFNVCNDANGAAFLDKWQQFPWFFGKPISPKLQAAGQTQVWVQYFEGGRLEHWPMDAKDPVKFGNLGDELLNLAKYNQVRFELGQRRDQGSVPGQYLLGPKIHVAPEFVNAYNTFTEQLFGFPVLEHAVEERDGKQYRTQWFQRTKMEIELENPPKPEAQPRFKAVGHEYVLEVLGMEPGQ